MPTEHLLGQLELFEDSEMGKVEKRSEDPGFFAKGGSGKMFGKGKVGEAVAGQSGKESQTPPGSGDKFASGGSGKMFGKGSAGKKVPGVSGKETQSG
jgi:hypothetical protein